jgi:hypothetical protein
VAVHDPESSLTHGNRSGNPIDTHAANLSARPI